MLKQNQKNEGPATRPFHKKGKGFTLLEIIISLFILIVISGIFTNYITTGYKATTFGQQQNDAIESARQGIETMVQEIRESGQSDQGGYLILENQPQSLKFYSDVNKDGTLEEVHYWLDESNFQKSIIQPDQSGNYPENNAITITLSKYVRNGTKEVFTYYNKDYPVNMSQNPVPYEPSAISNIRLINIYLEINVDVSRAPDSYILQSKAEIRTLKDNL